MSCLVFFILLGCSKKSVPGSALKSTASKAYILQLDSLREARVEKLRGPQGWLSVVGLHWLEEGINTIGAAPDNKITFPRISTETIGAYQIGENDVFFGKVEGVDVNSDGQEYMGGPVDVGYPPTIVNHESLYWYVMKRGEWFAIRLKDTLAEQRMNFKGLEYFPVQRGMRVTAKVREPKPEENVAITNVLGNTTAYPIAAYLDFTIDGQAYSLQALDEGGEKYFVVFGDETNGASSYGGGRFLYPAKASFGETTTLDFNLAENPPCAFSDFATCPLPPSQNMLPISIEAGEKLFR